ncbi:hypothetical protein ACTFIR_003946 [Dictyostelium discoideum]
MHLNVEKRLYQTFFIDGKLKVEHLNFKNRIVLIFFEPTTNELLQLLQPTHNESVKNNDMIEGETLKKLIHLEVDQVWVIVCRLSKMVHIVPCHKTIDAQHTAQLLLNHVFRLHGYPRTIVSDRDPRFLSDIWGRWAKTMDSKTKMTVAHRAQADDQTERMNREIKRILTKASTEYGENWSDIIPLIEFAMNSSMSKSTKMSPFQIIYGFNPPTPVNHFNSLTKTLIY